MSPKSKRLSIVLTLACLLGLSLLLFLSALRDNIVFFYTPSEIASKSSAQNGFIRLGGLVKDGSVKIKGLNSLFTITDGTNEIDVRYNNALPSLFREGQGVVAEGTIEKGELIATNVLAKHDENYMPAEIADKLKKEGLWKEQKLD